jgi:predicted dinucleotide-binding enzyme
VAGKEEAMKIGILGAGRVGTTLGRRWAELGHAVMLGVRDPASEQARALLNSVGHGVRAGTLEQAAGASEIVVLAVPWSSVHDALRSAGSLAGKILIDCTNPIAEDLHGLTLGHTTSAGEQVAVWAEGARVVKAFNTAGSRTMADPLFGGRRATLFLCGNDAAAKRVVTALGQELGFDPCDTGPLYHARYLEPMAMLWVDMAYIQGRGSDFALAVLQR